MRSATKVVLETIQVARHVGQLGLRPLEKFTKQTAAAGENLAFWVLKLQPLEDMLGRNRTKQMLDSYMQVKEVFAESVASLGHQSWMSALQSGAQAATAGLQQAGLQTRVLGPFDEHWNTLKVLKDLRTASGDHMVRQGSGVFRLTPKRFVQFMREAERKRRRAHTRDPIEDYVEWTLRSGSLSSVGPMVVERKLYTDVARIICFAFDRALLEANGTDLWGHELRVKVAKEVSVDDLGEGPRVRTEVGVEQVEAVVDRMLKSPDLRTHMLLAGTQRQLLINCSFMMLQLIADLTSDRHMQVSLLGHSLRLRLEPLPLGQLQQQVGPDSESPRFEVNERAINDLVDALIEEPEVQQILVPDILEAEIYRYALHRMICIAQFVLSQLRISLFGQTVSLNLLAEEEAALAPTGHANSEVHVPAEELQRLLDKIEDERRRIERELHARRGEPEGTGLKRTSLDTPRTWQEDDSPAPKRSSFDLPKTWQEDDGTHEFQRMAAQDRLSRSLDIHRVVPVPIELAYEMVSDFNQYPQWMPFCTSARTLLMEEGLKNIHCEVGFGIETGTALGTVGDTVRYRVMLSAPSTEPSGDVLRVARVVADATEGFTYGKRLVYDWRFIETEPGETEVRLDMFFQARSFFFLPVWDSMQSMITGVMMKKFMGRAEQLIKQRAAGSSGPRSQPGGVGSGAAPVS